MLLHQKRHKVKLSYENQMGRTKKTEKNEWKWNWMIWLIFKYDDFYCIHIALNNNNNHAHTHTHTVYKYVTFWLIPYGNVWNFNGMQNDTFLWHIRFISSKKMHSFLQRQMMAKMLLYIIFTLASFEVLTRKRKKIRFHHQPCKYSSCTQWYSKK